MNKHVALTDDPAVRAAVAAHDAERAFTAMPTRSIVDELRADFLQAETVWHEADQAFADTIPTTPTGALAKLQEVTRLLQEMDLPWDSLEMRHLQSVIAYIERSAKTASRSR